MDFSSDSDSEDIDADEARPIFFTFKTSMEEKEALAQFVLETEQQCTSGVSAFKLALSPRIVPDLVEGLLSTGLCQEARFEIW